MQRHVTSPIVTGRLHDLEMREEPKSRTAAATKAHQGRHLAVTRKWSALLKLLAVDGPNPGPTQILRATPCGGQGTVTESPTAESRRRPQADGEGGEEVGVAG